LKQKTLLLLLSFLIPNAASAAILHAGYYDRTLQLRRSETGACVVDPSRFMAQRDLGTSPTYATAIGEPDDPYLLADCAGPLALFASANNVKLIIDVTDVLFDPRINRDLRPGLQALMRTFFEHAQASADLSGDGFSSSNVVTAVIHNEAGNAAATRYEINAAVEEWDLYFPEIPTTAGYPISNAALPLPQMFPYRLDYVATWDYDTFDPLKPDDPANQARPAFYDPANPSSTSTKWGDFLSRLHPHQKVLLVIPAWYGCWQKDNGWRRWHVKYAASNFCRFALERPEVEAVTVWLWDSYPPVPLGERCPKGGKVDYQVEGTTHLIDTGILPYHDAIFDIASGVGTSCY
jgi:hypothetical protein